MPRRSTQSRVRADGESLTEPVSDDLCASCSQIPFEHLFQFTPKENPFQYSLGGLDVLRQRERTCRFCRFLTLIHEHIFSPYLKDAGSGAPSKNLLYLMSNGSKKPWFDVAGAKAPDLPRVPIAWLQLKQNEVETDRDDSGQVTSTGIFAGQVTSLIVVCGILRGPQLGLVHDFVSKLLTKLCHHPT
jgi:hypothetical protein